MVLLSVESSFDCCLQVALNHFRNGDINVNAPSSKSHYGKHLCLCLILTVNETYREYPQSKNHLVFACLLSNAEYLLVSSHSLMTFPSFNLWPLPFQI